MYAHTHIRAFFKCDALMSLQVVDSRGVHNVHGLPGIVGALGGVVAASISTDIVYGMCIFSRHISCY